MSDINKTRNLPRILLPNLIGNRRVMILGSMAVIGAGFAFNWNWLTAVGAAPLILALAPCAVMCGLGMCMTGGSKSCSSKTKLAETPDLEKD